MPGGGELRRGRPPHHRASAGKSGPAADGPLLSGPRKRQLYRQQNLQGKKRKADDEAGGRAILTVPKRAPEAEAAQIGRASCRERVWISVVAVAVKKRERHTRELRLL